MTTAPGGLVTFGSAQLFVDRMPADAAHALLLAAIDGGASRLDTAPLYGHGQSEGLVGEVSRRHAGTAVTTKVGLESTPSPPRWREAISVAMRRLPPSLAGALRSAAGGETHASQSDGPSGRFTSDAVKRSIERSLGRLGPIDRLLLHEVHPADIDDTLLELLAGYQRRGDVRALGVATGNAVTRDAVARSHGLFTVAHFSIDPIGAPAPELPSPVHRVGHGALGGGGRTLARLRHRLAHDTGLADRWKSAVTGTRFAGIDGPASALLARAATVGVDELLVATRTLRRVPLTILCASGGLPLSALARAVLDDALQLPGP